MEIPFLNRNVPQLPEDEVREVISERYDVAGELHALSSERDQNFQVSRNDGTQCVLKISNALEEAGVIDFQTSALRHLEQRNASLPVPRVVPDRDGNSYGTIMFADGSRHIVHMLGFLPGTPMSVRPASQKAKTRRNIGRLVADVDIAFQGFFHPAAAYHHPWNLGVCDRFTPLAKYIENADSRRTVEQILTHGSENILPGVRALRHQVIHQDAHDGNILVRPENPHEISGLIDFGDMVYGSIAAEVAIAADGCGRGSNNLVDAMCDIIAGYDAVLPLSTAEVDSLFDLIVLRNALSAVIVSARIAISPDDAIDVDWLPPLFERIDSLRSIGRRRVTQAFRDACRFPPLCPSDPADAFDAKHEEQLVKSRRALLGKNTTHFYAKPMHFERAKGCFLHSTDGNAYLDLYNNVPQVGHCNPHVVKAIARQAAVLNTNTRYLYGTILDYADRLTAKLAPHLDACIFVNSGSEANDIAWQIAKVVTGNEGGLLMEDAYHGITAPIREFSPGHPDDPLPDHLRGLIVPDPYRGPIREHEPDIASRYAADADRAIKSLAESGFGLAAFMIDSAFCSSGVPDVPDGYLQGVEGYVRAAKGLMICDEVQSGFGRMGQWWGHEHHGVRADIVTMGKPVGNGHPLGVIVTSKAILNQFIDATGLFSTFGGNTVACAAGLAVLDVIERDELIENGRVVGEYLRDQLRQLGETQTLIGNVRGHGMLAGLEFVSDRETRSPATEETAKLLELMRERQILVGKEGRDNNILKLRPSLVFKCEYVDQFVAALDDSLTALR